MLQLEMTLAKRQPPFHIKKLKREHAKWLCELTPRINRNSWIWNPDFAS